MGDSSVARPYDSQPCTSIVDPGIAVMRLGSRMSLAIETRTFDTPVIIGVSLNEFAKYGGRVVRGPARRNLFSPPDTGRAYPITMSLRSVTGSDTQHLTLTALIQGRRIVGAKSMDTSWGHIRHVGRPEG